MHDERLVEVVARAMAAEHKAEALWPVYTHSARAALDAVNASGIAWVAPWKMTALMHDAYNAAFKAGCSAGHFWSALRDAYLAETYEHAE